MKYYELASAAAFGLATITVPVGAQTATTMAAVEAPLDEEIIVTGQRASQRRALDAKRNAIGILDVAASDEIGRLPDRNVAEVIEHLPGVGVTYDQGEGRYVSIRGVPSNLNNYTLNGLEIGNPDGTTRALPLDIVSGQLLNRVEIAKIKTADMDGQGIGGSVNLVSQTAFDFKDRFSLSASGKAGYQELNGKVPYEADGSVAAKFGSDDQFGIVLGASYSSRDFVSEGFYPDNWRPDARFARGGVPDNIKFTEYSLARTRLGATGSLDWHPSDRQTLFVRGFYSKFTENEVRPRYRLDFATAAIVNSPAFHLNPDGLTGTVTGNAAERREDLRLNKKTKDLATIMVGGATEFDRFKLAYEGGYSRNQTRDRYPLWQFRCNPGPVNFDFSDKVFSAVPVTECTANQLQFRQYTDFDQLNVEKIWQGKVDGTYDLGDRGFLKFGAKYRDTRRDFDQQSPIYVRATTAANRFTLGQHNLGGPAVCVYPNSADTSACFSNGPTFDIPALQAFTLANLGGPLMPLDVAATLSANTLSDFSLSEKVAAAYMMANLQIGEVTITPGIRYERPEVARFV